MIREVRLLTSNYDRCIKNISVLVVQLLMKVFLAVSCVNMRYSVTSNSLQGVLIMDNTVAERQQRYREQIVKGAKKRLQVVLGRDEAKKLDNICTAEGINKTEFIRRAIKEWDR